MIAMIYHSLYSIIILSTEKETFSENSDTVVKLKISINTYLLIVILFHCPIVLLQDYSQCRKLCR